MRVWEAELRSYRHWTRRYMVDRTRELLYCRRHPEAPWLTPQANEILSTMLRPVDQGLEFGSGRSTLWLARRISHLTSVEHNQEWYGSVSVKLKDQGFDNVHYVFAPSDVPAERGEHSEYARAAHRFEAGSLDFVLVDGVYRDACARLCLDRLRPGGLLIVDNVNRYLPSQSRSPGSRPARLGPMGPVWSEVARTLAGWRHIWTSSGVSDTAIFVKP